MGIRVRRFGVWGTRDAEPLVHPFLGDERLGILVMGSEVADAAVLRRLTPDDAQEPTRLLLANQEAHAPFTPARPNDFFTTDVQRERLATTEHLYGILGGDAVAGMIELSNIRTRTVS